MWISTWIKTLKSDILNSHNPLVSEITLHTFNESPQTVNGQLRQNSNWMKYISWKLDRPIYWRRWLSWYMQCLLFVVVTIEELVTIDSQNTHVWDMLVKCSNETGNLVSSELGWCCAGTDSMKSPGWSSTTSISVIKSFSNFAKKNVQW